jgi:hypothetical protein
MAASTLLIVDAANVVGSVPDGWWRDRAGAARRLRDALAVIAETGLAEPRPSGLAESGPSALAESGLAEPGRGLPGRGLAPPLEVVMVVEGKARGVPSSETVRVVNAERSGDDAIVDLVRASAVPEEPDLGHRLVVVATSDRALRDRVAALGARVLGPRGLPYPANPGPAPATAKPARIRRSGRWQR